LIDRKIGTGFQIFNSADFSAQYKIKKENEYLEEIILRELNGRAMANSRGIAEKFNKRHDHVIRDIRKIADQLGSPQNWGRLFEEAEYTNEQNNQIYKEFLLTRDGFSLVVMGFTGAKALEWKLKYIEAFNKMEEALKGQNKSLPTTYKKALMQLLEQVEINEQLEEERKVLLPKADYHDEVLNKDGLITTTVVAKDLGFKSAAKLNQIMFLNKIIFKNQSGTWCPYANHEWLITEWYADYQSYEREKAKPCLKWTEKGRKWIVENFGKWCENLKED